MRKQAVKQAFENNSMEVSLEALGKSIARWTEQGEMHTTAVPGLSLFRREESTEPISGMYEPSVCLVAQGAKRVLLGDVWHEGIVVARKHVPRFQGADAREIPADSRPTLIFHGRYPALAGNASQRAVDRGERSSWHSLGRPGSRSRWRFRRRLHAWHGHPRCANCSCRRASRCGWPPTCATSGICAAC